MAANFYTMAKRVMIVEDDDVTRMLIQRQFAHAGFEPICAPTAEHALSLIQRWGMPHLALVDLHLPGASGLEFCHQVSALADLPILIMTAQSNYDAALGALERYADDFVLKPLNFHDLLARATRIVRRTASFDYAEELSLSVDDELKVNLFRGHIEVDGREISLTPVESKLLRVLLRNANRPITRRMLIDVVWPQDDVSEDALRVQIHRLRQKVRSKRKPFSYIQTERGVGYRFVVRDTHAMGFHFGA